MAHVRDLIVDGPSRLIGETWAGKVTGTSFVKQGGTSSQFLKADGSVSTHSGVDKVGTVTSVAASAGAGISVTGGPITTSGTLTITNTGVRSVTAGSTANIIKVNTNGTDTNITINNVAHATSADSATTATKATQDGSGNTITSKYVTLDTAQTVSGVKTFSNGVKFTSASSGYNAKGIIFAGGSRIGENTSGDLGVYGARKVYIRPASSSAASTEGICITDTDISPTTAASCSLGTSSLYYGGVYSSSFVKNGGTASQFLMANGTTKTLSTTVSQNSTDPVTSGAVWSFCDEFEEVTATALNYLNLSKQDKLTAGSGIALTQASGSAIISVAGVPREVLSTTHAGLVQLRNNNRLVPGQWYRITDYNPYFVSVYQGIAGCLASGHHRFDILVMATTYNTLAPDAYACHHEGDTYFQRCSLDKWKLKYALTDPYADLELAGDELYYKYSWCDANRDGGIIYEMIDENENECPYDFKNLKFRLIGGSFSSGQPASAKNINTIADYHAQKYFYTFTAFVEESDAHTYSSDDAEDLSVLIRDYEYCSDETSDHLYNNVIKPYYVTLQDDAGDYWTNYKQQFLNFIFMDYNIDVCGGMFECCDFRNNYFGPNCYNIYFISGYGWYAEATNNRFEGSCFNFIIDLSQGSGFYDSTIGYGNYNFYLQNVSGLTIGKLNRFIDIDSILSYGCGIGNNNTSISIGYPNAGSDINSVYIGNHNSSINIEPGTVGNTIGNSCNDIQIHFDSNYNHLLNKVASVHLAQGSQYNVFNTGCFLINLNNANNHHNFFGPGCSHIVLCESSENFFEGQNMYIICNNNSGATWQSAWDSLGTFSSGRKANQCKFLTGAKYINAYNTTSGSIMRRYIFAASASGNSQSGLSQFSFTSQSTSDSATYHAINYYVRRTTTTGALQATVL